MFLQKSAKFCSYKNRGIMLCTTMYAVIHCLTHSYDLNQMTYYIAALIETKKKVRVGERGRDGERIH